MKTGIYITLWLATVVWIVFISSKVTNHQHNFRKATVIRNANWANPQKDDLFLLQDSLGKVDYFKIAADITNDTIYYYPGKFSFNLGVNGSIYGDDFSYSNINEAHLYANPLQLISRAEIHCL